MASAPIAWSWRSVAYGAVLAVPAAAVAVLVDPTIGMPLAIGVLPAAAIGLRSSARERAMVVMVGVIAGAAIFLGSLVAAHPVIAVITVFVLCVAVALLAAGRARRVGPLVMALGLPLFGAGLSESSWSAGLSIGLLIVAGSVYGWLVSLLWPAASAPARQRGASAAPSAMLVYGIQLGVAGAITAALGFALGVDHPGWACTAALLVSRPDRRTLDARGWGRSLSVIAGALLACAIALLSPSAAVLALIVLVTLAVAAGTAGSRWYIFPFFSTLLVLSILLQGDTETPAHWFIERAALTLLGVAVALASAWVVPAVARSVTRRVG